MKAFILILFFASVAFSQSYSYDKNHSDDCRHCDNDIDFSFGDREVEDGELIIYKRGRALVEIDQRGTLYVKGEKIDTTNKERRLLKKYVFH